MTEQVTVAESIALHPDANGEFASPLDGALFMAALGIPQTPLHPKSKIAFLPAWQESASADPEQITKWARVRFQVSDKPLRFATDKPFTTCIELFENDEQAKVYDAALAKGGTK